MNMTEKKALFALSLIFTPGKPGINSLTERYKDPVELFDVLSEGRDNNIPHNFTAAVRAFDMTFAEDVTNFCNENGIKIITRPDDEYPEHFRNIDCPPLAFYCLGDSTVLQHESALTIVGARKATDYSVKAASYFAESIANEGHPIISGFALGIDSASHRGALNAGGKTVAVLGCGVFYDYPRGNQPLKKAIVENGAVISEYPPLAAPDRDNFTIRNRMIAGLGKAVLVVQAGVKSGSINTASHAISQGKDVFVVPPADIFSDIYSGQSVLIRDGGIPAFEPKDILMNI